MKTPMQEMFHRLEQVRFATDPVSEMFKLQEVMLEKEKEAIMNAYDIGWSDGNKGQDLNDLYYNETFNTKEK